MDNYIMKDSNSKQLTKQWVHDICHGTPHKRHVKFIFLVTADNFCLSCHGMYHPHMKTDVANHWNQNHIMNLAKWVARGKAVSYTGYYNKFSLCCVTLSKTRAFKTKATFDGLETVSQPKRTTSSVNQLCLWSLMVTCKKHLCGQMTFLMRTRESCSESPKLVTASSAKPSSKKKPAA